MAALRSALDSTGAGGRASFRPPAVAALSPYLVKAGEAAAQKAGEAGAEGIGRLWRWLKEKLTSPTQSEALAELAAKPAWVSSAIFLLSASDVHRLATGRGRSARSSASSAAKVASLARVAPDPNSPTRASVVKLAQERGAPVTKGGPVRV